MNTNTSFSHFEELFILLPVSITLITYRLRDVIEEAAPKGLETPIPKENHADYSLGPNRWDTFCYLSPLEKHVQLGFYYGDALPDPASLLVYEGKRTRHVKIHTLAEAEQPEIRTLILAATQERKTSQAVK
ncbi:MAG: hypothetical protein Fur0022_34120 [Anaerolineales bacterium]